MITVPAMVANAPIKVELPATSSISGSEITADILPAEIFVKREPDGLCGSRFQVEPGAVDDDARTNEVGEVRELGAHQVLDIDPVPFVADKQVLIG
jgi:hypothetical protein